MTPGNPGNELGPLLLDVINQPGYKRFVTSSPEEKLRWFFRFVNTPLPESAEEWRRLWEEVFWFYSLTMGPTNLAWAQDDDGAGNQFRHMGPVPPKTGRPEWIVELKTRAMLFLTQVMELLDRQKKGDGRLSSLEELYNLPLVPYPEGTRFSLVSGNRLIHLTQSNDSISPFLLTLGDLLAQVGDLSKVGRCPVCTGFFYKAGRRQYCSPQCTQKAHPAKARVRESRKRRARWQQARERLGLLLDDMDAVAHKRKLQRPRSEREIFEESEQALGRAQAAFDKAFPRKAGQGYKGGKAFLARADEQVKQLRKKVKGY